MSALLNLDWHIQADHFHAHMWKGSKPQVGGDWLGEQAAVQVEGQEVPILRQCQVQPPLACE